MNWGFLLLVGTLCLLWVGLFLFERRRITPREIALLVSLSAAAGISRVPFAGIPSVQPTTFFILMTGYVFGPFLGLSVGALAAWLSNFFLIQGPWTLWQMVAWGLVGASAGFVGKFRKNYPGIFFVLFGGLWGFLFGWIMNFWYWLSFSYPLTWGTWLGVNLTSFWFDAAHALSNMILLALAGRSVVRILKRFRGKMNCEVRP